MIYIVVDVESDGPIIGYNSMVCFGAVVLNRELDKTFYGQMKPIELISSGGAVGRHNPDALAVSGFSREEHMKFPEPKDTMEAFAKWLNGLGDRVTLISDNNGYDASWINYYFHRYTGSNPFGWTSRRIGDWFCGYFNDPKYQWKKHRKTKHTHHPVDDAKGNAEAVLWLIDQGFKLKI